MITTKHIKRVYLGFGLAPKFYESLLGQTVNENIQQGTAVSWKLLRK